MILGVDISTYSDELKKGARFYRGGARIDPVEKFRENGVSCARLRLWNDPKSENGAPYLGGDNGIETFIELSKLVTGHGMGVMLDFHYSDFWADPAKQFAPKAWRDLSSGLPDKVYVYTRETLERLKSEGIYPEYIQTGNEITNGMLWPYGKLDDGKSGRRDGYDRLTALLKSAGEACRGIFPDAKIVLHLERSGDKAVYDEFFTAMKKYGVDYDMIGVSYYPCWHGTPDGFFENMRAVRKFGKPVTVVETGYGFTREPYTAGGKSVRLALTDGALPDYPFTPGGQASFIRDFLRAARENGLYGVFYWEPLWIPGENVRWASDEGLRYIGEEGKSTLNEWANQCLCDYSGSVLPAFDEFK